MSNDHNLSRCSVLVEFNVSAWTARKLDRKVTTEVTTSKSASADAARVNKHLFAGVQKLEAIHKHVAGKRNEFYLLTLPWSDSGLRLLPMTMFMKFKEWSSKSEQEFDQLVSDFLQAYPTLVSAQAFKLGTMFDRDEFPHVDELARRFRFRCTMMPMPEAGDFRIDAENDIAKELQEEYAKVYQDRVEGAMGDLWKSLHDTLSHIAERLTPDGDKGKIFRDSLVTGALEMCERLTDLNVTKDPLLEKARKDLEGALLGVTPKELRENNAIRTDVKSQVNDILSRMGSFTEIK